MPPNVEGQQERMQGKDRYDIADDPVCNERDVARDGDLTQPSARAHEERREDECGRAVAENKTTPSNVMINFSAGARSTNSGFEAGAPFGSPDGGRPGSHGLRTAKRSAGMREPLTSCKQVTSIELRRRQLVADQHVDDRLNQPWIEIYAHLCTRYRLHDRWIDFEIFR
jgi:hypothetical protein